MDLAAAAAGATRKSLLRAGRSSWRTWAGAIPRAAASGPSDYVTFPGRERADASVRRTVFRFQLRPLRRNHRRTAI